MTLLRLRALIIAVITAVGTQSKGRGRVDRCGGVLQLQHAHAYCSKLKITEFTLVGR